MRYKKEIDESEWEPYKTTYEMTLDFHNRYEPKARVVCNYMPLIWVDDKQTGHRSLIIYFGTDHVGLLDNPYLSMRELMDRYVYPDGTPIGEWKGQVDGDDCTAPDCIGCGKNDDCNSIGRERLWEHIDE